MRAADYQRVSVSRLEERRGWLGTIQRDPGADPPDVGENLLPSDDQPERER